MRYAQIQLCLLVVGVIIAFASACESVDRGIRTQTKEPVVGEVVHVSNERFNSEGASEGFKFGGRKGLALGIVGGLGGAKGCVVTIRLGDTHVQTKPENRCRDFKKGDQINGVRTTTVIAYKSRSSDRWVSHDW